MSSSSKNMITLKISDEETFLVEEEAALLCGTIKNFVEDVKDTVIPLPGVNGAMLCKILEWCRKHANIGDDSKRSCPAPTEEELEKWDAEFINDFDVDTLALMTMAANYLNCAGVLDLLTSRIADIIKDMTVEQVRQFFNIKGDFTPEEEERIRKEAEWAHEIP